MNVRSLVSVAALSVASMVLLAGCPEDNKGGAPTSGAKGPTAQPKGTTPASGTTPTVPASSSGGNTGGDTAGGGKGVIKGTVKFTGEDFVPMEVPKKRKDAEFCKTTEVKHNAILIKDKKIQDVWVGLWNEQVKDAPAASGSKTIDQKDCNYHPRVIGLMPGQEIEIKNSDPTMHNVNVKLGAKSLFNVASPKDAPIEKRSFDDIGIYRFQCDVHSWMRAFIVVTDNPYSAISGEDGNFTIEKVPDGKFKVVAWHSIFGKKEKDVEVKGGEVKVDFEYDGAEEEPPENQGELDDLF